MGLQLPEPTFDLSPICLGTADFGSRIERRDAFALIDRFVALGGNFFDSAHIYAAWREGGVGASERTLGEWVRAHGAGRAVAIGTKGGHPPLDRMDEPRLAREELDRDLDESLARLGVDRIDLYWLHRDDPRRPVEEIVGAAAGFVRDGRVRALGASNWHWGRLAEANQCAQRAGLPGFVAAQVGWALADRAPDTIDKAGVVYMDEAAAKMHARMGLPVAAFSAQAHGFFGEENRKWAVGGFAGSAPRGWEYDTVKNRRRLRRAMELAAQKGCTANQIALAWLMCQSFPVHPIVGAGRPEHLDESMLSLGVRLTPDECSQLK